MRIKVSVKDSQSLLNINIQDIELLDKSEEGLPKIYFKCHKKYEDLLWGQTLIFHDKLGREIFRSSKIRLEFRYYESDLKLNKVKLSANAIEFENIGLLSKTYLRKLLKKSCNAKVEEISEQNRPNKKQRRQWWLYGSRFIDLARSRMRKAESYKKLKVFRYIFKNISPKLITLNLLSTAPT